MDKSKKEFRAENCFISTRGLHFDFVDTKTAQAFYQKGLMKGLDCLILEGTQVIDSRAQKKLHSAVESTVEQEEQ